MEDNDPQAQGTGWEEEPLDREEEQIDGLAERVKSIQRKAQEKARRKNPNALIERGFHAKGVGVRAKFRTLPDVPQHLRVGLFQPGTEYDALVRFSNAQSEVKPDVEKDQRGLAIRLKTVAGEKLLPHERTNIQDFLLSNTPASFASDPVEFIDVAELLLGSRLMLFPTLWKRYGLRKAWRILSGILQPIRYKTWQASRFWTRTPFKYGDRAVKFMAQPSGGGGSPSEQSPGFFRRRGRENYLRERLKERLDQSDVTFDFCIQLFADKQRTPIEDASKEWKESDAPPLKLAQLVIPKQNLDESLEKEVERMAFTPWNTVEHRPLGSMNRARKKVYDTSARQRGRPAGVAV